MCGKAFNSISGKPVCPECAAAEEEEYDRARFYIKDNPKSPIAQVSNETGVSIEKIRQYMQKGLIEEASLEEGSEVKCQICNKHIQAGNYCLDCMSKLKKGLDKKKTEEKKPELTSFSAQFRDRKK